VVEDIVKKAPAKKESDARLRIPKSFFLSWREVSENMTSSINSIISNKTRSLLTMLGIIIGVGALIAMLAVGTGAQRAIEKQMSSLGTNLLAVIPGNRSQGGMSLGRGAVSRLTLADAKALARSVSNVTRTDSNVQGSAQLVYGPRNYRSRVTGVRLGSEALSAESRLPHRRDVVADPRDADLRGHSADAGDDGIGEFQRRDFDLQFRFHRLERERALRGREYGGNDADEENEERESSPE